jgi:hypothetical protein
VPLSLGRPLSVMRPSADFRLLSWLHLFSGVIVSRTFLAFSLTRLWGQCADTGYTAWIIGGEAVKRMARRLWAKHGVHANVDLESRKRGASMERPFCQQL